MSSTVPSVALRRTSLSDDLVAHLAGEIVRGRLRPRTPLSSEADLAARFGVSKPIVREALRVLASFGLVRVHQGKRTIVQEESAWDILAPPVQDAFLLEGRAPELTQHYYEARRVLEMSAAAFAAERATDEQRHEILETVERMSEIARGSRDLTAFLEQDRAFHDAIARAGANVVLRQVTRTIHAFLSSAWSSSLVTPDELQAVAEQHARIADAIVAGDPAQARAATEDHLLWAQDHDLRLQQASLAVSGSTSPTANL
jgi:DNA-binding FadR family transcriptional regulator